MPASCLLTAVPETEEPPERGHQATGSTRKSPDACRPIPEAFLHPVSLRTKAAIELAVAMETESLGEEEGFGSRSRRQGGAGDGGEQGVGQGHRDGARPRRRERRDFQPRRGGPLGGGRRDPRGDRL